MCAPRLLIGLPSCPDDGSGLFRYRPMSTPSIPMSTPSILCIGTVMCKVVSAG
jgi:hypothetical protein